MTTKLQDNGNVTAAEYTVLVASGVGLDCLTVNPTNYGASTGAPRIAVGVELQAAGTLEYVNRFGVTCTITNAPAGYKPCKVAKITTNTNVAVVLYF